MVECILCQTSGYFEWWDYERRMGLFGLCSKCNHWLKSEEMKFDKERVKNA